MTARITTNHRNEKIITLDIAKNFGKSVFFGYRKSDKRKIYLSLPTFDCGWYWGFGYLGNRDEHYHLSSYQNKEHMFTLEDGSFKMLTEKRNINMYDALLEDYDLNPCIKKNLWEFCEIVLSVYALKESAETFHIGGSHMTSNPCKSIIKNTRYENRINEKMIPALCTELLKMFLPTEN